jgi:hypothetical protein
LIRFEPRRRVQRPAFPRLIRSRTCTLISAAQLLITANFSPHVYRTQLSSSPKPIVSIWTPPNIAVTVYIGDASRAAFLIPPHRNHNRSRLNPSLLSDHFGHCDIGKLLITFHFCRAIYDFHDSSVPASNTWPPRGSSSPHMSSSITAGDLGQPSLPQASHLVSSTPNTSCKYSTICAHLLRRMRAPSNVMHVPVARHFPQGNAQILRNFPDKLIRPQYPTILQQPTPTLPPLQKRRLRKRPYIPLMSQGRKDRSSTYRLARRRVTSKKPLQINPGKTMPVW